MNKQDEADAEQREGMWKAIVCVALFWLAAIALIVLVTGCSYTYHPDGTETFTADPDAFLKAIEILEEK